jgi:hypothetical protein
LRRQRTQRADRFNRKQARIALGKRRWLRLTEIADECARKPGSLAVDDKERERALETLRRSILTGEFVDNQGRSRILNMHPSPLAHFRFEPSAAANAEWFNSIARHLCIRYQDCVDWFNWLGLDLPRRLRREPSSTVSPEAIWAEPAQSPPTLPSEPQTVIGPLDCKNIETARVPQAGKLRPKGVGEKKTNAIEAAKGVASDWLTTHRWLPNKKEHHRLTMNRLRDECPGNHLMSGKVKELIDDLDPVKEFGARRRDVGRHAR